MSDQWKPAAATRRLKLEPCTLVCDALLNQNNFAGVGNIIKNEVLFRVGVQPHSLVGAVPVSKLGAVVKQARVYSFEFLEWRRSFFCPRCQKLYDKVPKA